jgi:hypothetical protein
MKLKVISGGQTGADFGALRAAYDNQVETGGMAPRHYWTEAGYNYDLKHKYKLIEEQTAYGKRSIMFRTKQNIIDSDATVLFGNMNSSGSRLTIKLCKQFEKLYLINPDKQTLINWIIDNDIKVMNVAGNRESVNPGIEQTVYNLLVDVLTELKKYE